MSFPKHKGPHPVGYATFTFPVTPRVFGRSRVKDGPALKLEEVAFSVFYPASTNEKSKPPFGVPWMPRPVGSTLRGYSRFLNIPAWLLFAVGYVWASLLKMPVYNNAKILAPPKDGPAGEQAGGAQEKKWPLIIMSHGLSGTKTTYSQVCGNLASEGFVVLAVEHRDRSGPMVLVQSSDSSKSPHIEERPYLKLEDAQWEGGKPPPGRMPLRTDQLEFRRAEIYEAVKAFSDVVNGQGNVLKPVDHSVVFDWECWRGRVECERNVIVAGHSFGSATALSLLSQKPTTGFQALSISQVLLLDPWVEPFEDSVPLPSPLDAEHPAAACVICSEAFTLWDGNWDYLRKIVKGWKAGGKTTAHLMTILRSAHNDFSDWGVITPRNKETGTQVLHGTHDTAMKFIRGSLDEELKGKGQVMEIIKGKKNKRQIKGEPGEMFVHE